MPASDRPAVVSGRSSSFHFSMAAVQDDYVSARLVAGTVGLELSLLVARVAQDGVQIVMATTLPWLARPFRLRRVVGVRFPRLPPPILPL
jgi:hypothetical protein